MLKVLVSLCICLCLVKLSLQICKETNFGSDYVILTCMNGTQSFPTTKKSVIMLYCLDCNIPVLDEKTILKKFEGATFNLSNSHVQVISTNAFKSFRKLTRRFLFQNNEFNYIAPKVFNNFTILDEINFRNSKITQLDPGCFNGTTVNRLDLSQNYLTNVSRIFDGLRTNSLNLSANRIKDISESAFDKVLFSMGRFYSQYSSLDLSKNIIQRIPPNTFKASDRNSIRMLILSKNSITTIESKTFVNMTTLLALLLNDNFISQLYPDSFKGLTNLANLVLQKNRLQKIPRSLFADLQKLEALDLSQNYLTALDAMTFSGLQNLQILNLSYNNLRVFEDSHVFPLVRLISLDITDTKIHTISLGTILQHHWRLMYLVINDNFWTCKDLTKMYKKLGRQFNGFSNPAQHFDVPNLHGIACSKDELKSYDTLTFDQFLNIISQEPADSSSFVDDDLMRNMKTYESIIRNISVIKSMSVVIAVVLITLFLHFVIKSTVMCLQQFSFMHNTRFTFFYNQNQDTVKVLS